MAIINGTQIGADNVSGRDVGILLREKPFPYLYPDGVTRMSYDLVKLCRSNNVNKWSKYKPVWYKATSTDLGNVTLTAQWGNSGFVPVRAPAMALEGLIEYRKPAEDAVVDYRLADFALYNHEAEAPFVINPAIEKTVPQGESGTFEYSITIKVPDFIVALSKELNGLNYVNIYEIKSNGYEYRQSAPVTAGYVDITDSLTYTSIGNLETIKREYLVLYSRYNVAGNGLFDRYSISDRLTCSAAVRAFDGNNNATVNFYNMPNWFNELCVGSPYSLAPVDNNTTFIKLRQNLKRSLLDDEVKLLMGLGYNLYYKDYDVQEAYRSWEAYPINDARLSVAEGLDTVTFEMQVSKPSFSRFIDIRLTPLN